MASSANQDLTRKLSIDERQAVVQALNYAHKGASRQVTQATEDLIKDHYQKKAYLFQSLANRFATTPLDLE